jgi:hypothetical protein|tara:strand:- start:7451 stop:8887 length:1437 start_codon:yes stop_codon:yes gene_type:complete
MKLGVIVPYRGRPTHLRKFTAKIKDYLGESNIPFHLIVVEQNDDLPFNRGKLLNIGYNEALKKRCEYVVFHDVDMLPLRVDYSPSDVPLHLATVFKGGKQEVFDTYFGGVTLFPIDTFKRINGYSNEYWGWGFEDDDLLLRLTEQGIGTDFIVHKSEKEFNAGLYLHGEESYMTCLNTIDLEQDFTLHCTFKPDDIIPDYQKTHDEYCVFSIPGWDTSISYNSFNRYRFEIWDVEKECYTITSEHSPPKLTRITVTYDRGSRVLKMYQDGRRIGQKILKRKVFDSKPQFFYLGTGIPVREGDIKSYRGLVKDFCYWDTCLAGNEVFELHDNYGINYLTSQGQYSSASNLKIYYDMKHCILDREFDYRHGKVINLVNPANTRSYAKTENCIPKTEMELTDVKIMKPFRRHSSFELQKHQRNGYFNGRWRTESTRLNQVHFYDQVANNKTNLQNDGLTTLHFELLSEKNTRNITHLKVNL